MSRFVQLHLLTAYPPSNPNRDDLGRPKTALLGNVQRMRISSQAIKRAVREADGFRAALAGQLGERTQRLGDLVERHLADRQFDESKRLDIARQIAGVFGKLKNEKDKHPTHIEQLAFVSPEEKAFALDLADRVAAGEELPKEKDLAKMALRTADGAADIAMFGRMLAGSPEFNREAAVQVAHAITVNKVEVENDYYTAVDDLKVPSEDAGAGFIGEAGFAAGVFYLYVCVDRALLVENLGGDAELAARALEVLIKTLASASPSGKRNSFANHVRAEYVLAERGDSQPRSLASAFVEPVSKGDQVALAVKKLTRQREAFAAVYGRDWDAEKIIHVGVDGSATLDELAGFCTEDMPAPAQ
ncbi:MAG: type I-E CRISPR-associated protein Cas7/Cse4/CasC [Rhodospirillaceae bacterium]